MGNLSLVWIPGLSDVEWNEMANKMHVRCSRLLEYKALSTDEERF